MKTRTKSEIDTPEQEGHGPPSWLLLIPGCTLVGMSLGLFLGQPGFGMLGGIGVGFVWWGGDSFSPAGCELAERVGVFCGSRPLGHDRQRLRHHFCGPSTLAGSRDDH